MLTARLDPAAGKERAAEGEYCGSTHVPTGAAAPSGPSAAIHEPVRRRLGLQQKPKPGEESE